MDIPIDPALLEDEGGMEDAEGEVDGEYEYEYAQPAHHAPVMPTYPRASSSRSSLPVVDMIASPGSGSVVKKKKGRPVGSTNSQKHSHANGHHHVHHPPTKGKGPGKGKGKGKAAAYPRMPADTICSFCSGSDHRNKLGVPEKMVSCALCGRSGHPSCLQMTSRLARTVMTYDWTCLDCKACEICDMRDQDVMFCDGCDRGYHRWCLDPPLAVMPKGAWYCTLCLPANVARKRQSSKNSPSVPHIIHPKPLTESPGSPGRRRGRPPKALQASRLSKSVHLASDVEEDEDVFLQQQHQPRIKIKSGARDRKGKGKQAEVSPSLVVKLRVPSGGARKAVEIEDEEEKVPYGGVITGADADTTRTAITDPDKDRFQKSLSAAESKLGGPPPLLPDYDPQLSTRGSPAPSMSNGNGDNASYTPSLSHTTSTPQLARGLRDRLLQQTISGSAPSPGPSTPNGHTHAPAASTSEKIKRIRFGVFDIDTWYSAPYPEEYQNVPDGRLWLCEFCLKYMKSGFVAERHRLKCKTRHPPGDEIYRDNTISVFEVDGRKNKIYCQNLCLLAKMFLDHKTLYYDVEPFLFYVMTEVDDLGARFVGYFSKEKRSIDNNVSCIMTLPVRQRKGWGQLLIDFSYALSKKEKRVGSPEKPLSGLGEVTYKRYWKITVFDYLRSAPSTATMDDISAATSLTIEDIYATLLAEDMIVSLDSPPRERSLHTPTRGRGGRGRGRGRGSINRRIARADSKTETDGVSSSDSKSVIPKRYTIRFDRTYVEAVMIQHESRGYLTLKPDRLKYHPFLVTRDPVKPPGTIAKATLTAAGAGTGAGVDADEDADAEPGVEEGTDTPEVVAHGQDKATLQLVAKLSESPVRSLRKRPASSSEPASTERPTRPKRARHDGTQLHDTPRRSTRGSAPASAQKLRQVTAAPIEAPPASEPEPEPVSDLTNGYATEELDEDGEWEADDTPGADEDAEGEDEYVE